VASAQSSIDPRPPLRHASASPRPDLIASRGSGVPFLRIRAAPAADRSCCTTGSAGAATTVDRRLWPPAVSSLVQWGLTTKLRPLLDRRSPIEHPHARTRYANATFGSDRQSLGRQQLFVPYPTDS